MRIRPHQSSLFLAQSLLARFCLNFWFICAFSEKISSFFSFNQLKKCHRRTFTPRTTKKKKSIIGNPIATTRWYPPPLPFPLTTRGKEITKREGKARCLRFKGSRKLLAGKKDHHLEIRGIITTRDEDNRRTRTGFC